MKEFLFIFLFILLSIHIIAQDCESFHLQCKVENKEEWVISTFSHSRAISEGQDFEFEMEIMEGKDYQISVCGDKTIGNVVNFKILNRERKVMYDNAEDDFVNQFSFSCLASKKVTIHVTLPDSGSGVSGCVGVLIEEMVSLPTGF